MANKYLVAGGIIGGLVLVIIAYATLYQADYRALLANNPDKIAIVIDYNSINRLEIITRGRDWSFNQEVLRIRYNEQETTLYSNANILARSQWRVKTKGGTLQERSYTAGTIIDYNDFGDSFNIFKVLNYQRKHVLTESQIFSSKISIENFPEKYYVEFKPIDSKEYKLTWVISDLKFFDWQKQGTVTDCMISFVGNVKVDWCKSKDKIDYVYLSKQYSSLYVHFKAAKGLQYLDVSLIDPTTFDGLWYRNKKGIFINTFTTPARVSGQDLKVKWGYDTENVLVPYKFAKMPFWIEHDLPFAVDLCDGKISFGTTYPTSTYINWDYNVFVPNYKNEMVSEPCAMPFDATSCYIDRFENYELVFCDGGIKKDVCKHTVEVPDGTFIAITRSRPIALSDMASCPLERNKRYNLYHYAEIPVGSEIIFDVSLELNLPTLDKATFVIPKPSWTSTAPSDYNTGNGYDFNWTKVVWDGNIMPVGDDRIHNDQNQAFYDQNLLLYYRMNDLNTTGALINDTNRIYYNTIYGAGTISRNWGLWDTNTYYTAGSGHGIGTSLDGTDLNEITISMWVKAEVTTVTRYFADNSSGATGFGFRHTGTIIDFFAYSGGASGIVSKTAILDGNRWRHIAAVHSSTANKIYFDGMLVATTTYAAGTGIDDSAGKMGIGAEFTPTSDGFVGSIEEFKFYDRALSASEIQADYNSWMKSSYYSPIFNAGATVQWDTMQWTETIDLNNNVGVDYRACNDADCAGGDDDWKTGLKHCVSTACELTYAVNSQWFQYKVNLDTNKQQWNTVRSPSIADGDKGKYAKFANATVNYSNIATCNCPTSPGANWLIQDGSNCTLSTTCNMPSSSVYIMNGSLTITSTGTLRIPFWQILVVNKNGGKLVIEKGGKLIMDNVP